VNAGLLREIATQPDYFYQSPTPNQLVSIYTRLAGNLRNTAATNLHVTDTVSSQFDVVPDSFAGVATPQVTGNTLRWFIPNLEQGRSTISFAIKPKECGFYSVSESATVSYDDNRGNRQTLTFPLPSVNVLGCGATSGDIFIRDNVLDTGIIPSAQPWWSSPDVWVRQADDGGTEHQNPQAGRRNYIYARVSNRSVATVSLVDVRFYYGASGLGLGWPGSWTAVPGLQQITSIPPGGRSIVSIPWDVPNLVGHFCIRVHIDSPEDPLGDSQRIGWNNNVTSRNMHIFEFPQPPVGQCRLDGTNQATDTVSMDVINTLTTSTQVELTITSDELLNDAQLRITLGALAGRWSSLDGLVQEDDGRLLVTTLPATIYGIQMNPSEIRPIQLEINAAANSRFIINVAEIVRGDLVGGNSYQRWLAPCSVFLPMVHKTPP